MSKARLNYFLTLFLLSIFGVLGNYLTLSLFFGVSFIFGSIAVLLAIRLLGTAGAVTVAVLAGSYTYIIWGHPYAMIIFTAEAIVVGMLWHRKIPSLALADIIFWVVIGMPLVWLFYSGVMNMEAAQTFMIALKQAVNGVTNAIVATYLVLLIPPQYILKNNEEVKGKIQLKDLLFTTLLGIPLVFSFVIVSLEYSQMKENLENSLAEQLEISLEYLVRDDLRIDLKAVHEERLRHKSKFDVMIFTDDDSFVDSTLPFNKELEFTHKGSIKKVNEKLSLWMPDRNNMPLMLWWNKAYYFIDKPLSGKQKGKIYVLHNTRTVINNIQMNILTSFKLLFTLIIIGGVAAYSISRSLTGTIDKLTATTKNIPEKLKNNLKIEWPKSHITELLQLSSQAKIMSDSIGATFDDVNLQAKTILESSINSIITIDDRGIILGFNPAAESLFGYSRDEVLGENLSMLIPEQYKDMHKDFFEHSELNNQKPFLDRRVELIGLHKNGSSVAIEASITKTKLKDKTTYTGIITDITERKVNEQLKRDFISTVSHELRTPLTSINGSVKLIRAKGKMMSAEKFASLLDITSRNIDRLTDLINDLLDFEKLDSSGVEYEKERIHVKTLILMVIEQTRSLAEQANIVLKVNVEQEFEFVADLKRVVQIMLNLVSNAIKFSPENRTVEIGCDSENKNIKLYVKDHGDGISEEFKKNIFERFTQADSADNRQIQRGTGLGLAISKRMTEDMGGTIGFESKEGIGSIFFIVFPLAE